MMDNNCWNFVIPLLKDDLRSATVKNQYVVQEILTLREVTVKLQDECKKGSQATDVETFFERFDFFYSIICHFSELNEKEQKEALDVAMRFTALLEARLSLVLAEQMGSAERLKYANLLKMILYVLVQLLEAFEYRSLKSNHVLVLPTKGRKKGGAKKELLQDFEWENEKFKMLNHFHQLCLLPLKRLWDPPIAEEDFVNLINNCAFKLMENPGIAQKKVIREAVVDLLGVSLKAFGHSLGLSLKIIQMLQQFEHSVPILVDTVYSFVHQYGNKNTINDIIREIGRMETKELARDSVGTRSLAQFLLDFSQRSPSVILPSISLLLTYLDGEAYNMRNCVLSIFGEIVLGSLSPGEMDQRSKEIRDTLLDKLEEHIHDVNAFVRSRVLQIWQRLCGEQVIPLDRQGQLLRLLRGRLMDRSCQVRRNAIQFFSAFLQGNPLIAKVSERTLLGRLEDAKKKLDEMGPPSQDKFALEEEWEKIVREVRKTRDSQEKEEDDQVQDHTDLDSLVTEVGRCLKEGDGGRALTLVKGGKKLFPPSEDQDDPMGQEDVEDLESCILIIKNIFFGRRTEEEKERKPCELMKQQLLVRYLTDCVDFSNQMHETLTSVSLLLSSKVTTDVLEAMGFFVRAQELGVEGIVPGVRKMLILIWSKEPGIRQGVVNAYKQIYLTTNGNRCKAEDVVHSLFNLMKGSTIGELLSLEELLQEFVKSKELNKQVMNTLWLKFSKETGWESHAALVLLSMTASADPGIVEQNLDLVVEVGFGAQKDFLFAKEACSMLLKLSNPSKPNQESESPPYRLAQQHKIFERLQHLIIMGFEVDDRFWVPFTLQAIKVIYKLAEHPDIICESILKELIKNLQNFNGVDSFLLMRFLSVVGEVALGQLVHLDIFVFGEMKRRLHLRQEDKKKKRRRRSALCAPISSSQSSTSGESLEQGGVEADDSEADFIAKVCETEILHDENLFGKLCPLVVEICANPTKYPDLNLRAAAAMTLGKLMLVSSSFCESQLALLMTLMGKSCQALIRANCIILVGDLLIRFPNLVEPWTSNLYQRLHDDCVSVRKNTLAVLTHLILNDLLKVKSQISDLALCTVDGEPSISQGAKTFFHELSKKGNSIYNILPDIMSHLSDTECGTSQENFQIILKFLMKFVEKERQLELLVEKLCLRFNLSRSDRQDEDLAYCLSLIPFNERCLRKLQENSACFAQKMNSVQLYAFFQIIINNARKKENNGGVLVEELEVLLHEFHTKGMDKENMDKIKTFAKKHNGTKRVRRKRVSSSESPEEKVKSVCLPRRTNRKVRVPTIVFSDSESE